MTAEIVDDEEPMTANNQARIVNDRVTELMKGPKAPAVPMEQHEKARLRAAAVRAKRVYPGPAGELLSRDILTWEEFGYRLGSSSLILRLVEQIMTAELPKPHFTVPAVAVPVYRIEGERG